MKSIFLILLFLYSNVLFSQKKAGEYVGEMIIESSIFTLNRPQILYYDSAYNRIKYINEGDKVTKGIYKIIPTLKICEKTLFYPDSPSFILYYTYINSTGKEVNLGMSLSRFSNIPIIKNTNAEIIGQDEEKEILIMIDTNDWIIIEPDNLFKSYFVFVLKNIKKVS